MYYFIALDLYAAMIKVCRTASNTYVTSCSDWQYSKATVTKAKIFALPSDGTQHLLSQPPADTAFAVTATFSHSHLGNSTSPTLLARSDITQNNCRTIHAARHLLVLSITDG